MGSLTSGGTHYPDASDKSLVLTHPTAAEKEQTWRLNHNEWGGALDLPAYLEREPFLASTPLAADGGMVHWILTTDLGQDEEEKKKKRQQRSVLASCETIRKRVLYAPRTGNGVVREGLGYGIGSVYTYPEFRGKKYAARMLRELGAVLKTWPAQEEQLRKKRSQTRGNNGHGNGHSDSNGNGTGNGTAAQQATTTTTNGGGSGSGEHADSNGHARPQKAVCSALWSDIGKKFYASKGWPAYPSAHVEFYPSSASSQADVASLLEKEESRQPHDASLTLTPVTAGNLARLCAEDEARLRDELARRARSTGRTAFAFAPDPDVFRWHWAREEFISSHVFPGRPASGVRGMIATVSSTPAPAPADSTAGAAAVGDTNGGSGGRGREGERQSEARVWAIWARNYGADGATNPDKNTLYILRLVTEEDNNGSASSSSAPSGDRGKALQLAFDAVMQSALDAARPWGCGTVHLWNPTAAVRELIAGSALAHRFVDRETDSIPSMMWYGGEEGEGREGEEEQGQEHVDWIANEKYCWC